MENLVQSLNDYVNSEEFQKNPKKSGLLTPEQMEKIGQKDYIEIGAIKYVGDKTDFYILGGKLTTQMQNLKMKEKSRIERFKRFFTRAKTKHSWWDGIIVMGTVNGVDVFTIIFTRKPNAKTF